MQYYQARQVITNLTTRTTCHGRNTLIFKSIRPFATAPRTLEEWKNPVFSSSIIESKKSTFQAHCTRITSPSEISLVISHLIRSSSRFKRATHCMYASRTINPESTTNTDSVTTRQDDGNEKGAGDVLEGVLTRAGTNDVLVIVWRWYGGVQLGGERWRMIGQVAREALREGGFLGDGGDNARKLTEKREEGSGKKRKRK